MTDNINTITAANLRAVADLLDQHPDIEQPYITTHVTGRVSLNWYLNGRDDERAEAAAIVKAIDGGWERGEADYSGPLATWRQERDGLALHVQVTREAVCERIVTGEETVTIPAKPAEPERTETREVVEWRCQPLLSEAAS